jgi:hypothetical protein
MSTQFKAVPEVKKGNPLLVGVVVITIAVLFLWALGIPWIGILDGFFGGGGGEGVRGCMDSTATNYNSSATIDDGSCYSIDDPLVHLGSGGCVGGNQEVPEENCDANPMCTTIGRQFNGCWHILSGDSPSQADREKYAWGLFRKTDSGYVPL